MSEVKQIDSKTCSINKNEQEGNEKPKPCCVCTDEKEARDKCLLFNGQEDVECVKLVERYKECMKSYGFTI